MPLRFGAIEIADEPLITSEPRERISLDHAAAGPPHSETQRCSAARQTTLSETALEVTNSQESRSGLRRGSACDRIFDPIA